MNKKLKYLASRNMKRSLWAAAAALLFMQGCVTIDDNTDDCFPLARLRFEYTYNMKYADLIREQVMSLDLYAYDKWTGSFVATHRYTQADLVKEDYSLTLKWLRQGDYCIIAYGNCENNYYYCADHVFMSDARVKLLSDDPAGTMTHNPCHFFYGYIEIAKDDKQEKLVSMIKDTNDITVTVRDKATRAEPVWEEGLPALTIKLELPNGTIKHDNSIDAADTRTMTHISLNSFGEFATELTSTQRVGRLLKNDGSTIKITGTNSGVQFTSENLTAKIAALFAESPVAGMTVEEYLDREDTYELVYDLEMEYGVYIVTLVKINKWKGIENPIGGL